jgi:hypothetical protein
MLVRFSLKLHLNKGITNKLEINETLRLVREIK